MDNERTLAAICGMLGCMSGTIAIVLITNSGETSDPYYYITLGGWCFLFGIFVMLTKWDSEREGSK